MWCTTETGQRRSILGIGRLFPSQPFAVPPCRTEKREYKNVLRQELPKDYETVHHLIADSFATAEHSDGNEADLVAALRTGPSFVPALSRVARGSGRDRRPYFIDKSPCGQHHGACPGPRCPSNPNSSGRALEGPSSWTGMPSPSAWAFRMYWSWEAGLIIQGSDTPQRRGFTSKPPRGSLPTISWQSACGKTQVPFTEP